MPAGMRRRGPPLRSETRSSSASEARRRARPPREATGKGQAPRKGGAARGDLALRRGGYRCIRRGRMKAGKGGREKEEATADRSCDGAGGRGRKGESRTVRGRRGRKKNLTCGPRAHDWKLYRQCDREDTGCWKTEYKYRGDNLCDHNKIFLLDKVCGLPQQKNKKNVHFNSKNMILLNNNVTIIENPKYILCIITICTIRNLPSTH